MTKHKWPEFGVIFGTSISCIINVHTHTHTLDCICKSPGILERCLGSRFRPAVLEMAQWIRRWSSIKDYEGIKVVGRPEIRIQNGRRRGRRVSVISCLNFKFRLRLQGNVIFYIREMNLDDDHDLNSVIQNLNWKCSSFYFGQGWNK